MKVAILHSGNTKDMKGIMNFVHEKALRMQKYDNLQCDVYCVRSEYTRLFTWLIFRKKKDNFCNHLSYELIDGVVYNYIWVKYSLYDSFISRKLFKNMISMRYYHVFNKKLKGYDVISTHNLECHQIALKLNNRKSKRVVCTWHGSDIHTLPFEKPEIKSVTKKVIENANINFFVSKNLLEISNRITQKGNKQVLYTGPSSSFYRYEEAERKKIRLSLDQDADYIVGFVGNLIPIKNVMIIPDILFALNNKLPINKRILLVIVGDGPLREKLNNALEEKGLHYLFLGNVKPADMPRIMNGLDLLLLPSRNEGLPLVTLEALKCGLFVVGSRVGGIPEVIGDNNCFVLDESFVGKASSRMAEVLMTHESSEQLSDEFSWKRAIEKEISTYRC